MNGLALALTGIGLLLANAFFVIAEYGLVGSRRSRIESGARKGNRIDALILAVLDSINRYVAGIQVYITLVGILIGAIVTDPLTDELQKILPAGTPEWVGTMVTVVLIVYPLVVFGELVPKYIALSYPESVARFVVRILRISVTILSPLIWLLEKTGQGVLNLLTKLGLNNQPEDSSLVRDELFFMLRSGGETGDLDESHSDMVAKTLKLDRLDAEDSMIHRLDIQWLPVTCDRDDVLARIKDIPHSRIPVCKDDLDEVVGIVYLQDIVRALGEPDFDLANLVREPVFIPENLTLDRLVNLMREEKTQIVIVQDEYGGTSGLVTLEDVVEEIFGDLDDALESERPAIERTGRNRLSVRPDVRYDELLDFLNLEETDQEDWTTESVISILIEKLDRTPKMGDTVDLPIGRLRVDAIAQRRVTRVGVYLRRKAETA